MGSNHSKKFFSRSTEDTERIAAEFASTLQGGEIVTLEGDLGAGKTAFVQGVAKALGVGDGARSPTFAIMNLYKTSHPTIRQLVHLDCYRLKTAEDITNLGLDEWIGDAASVLLIEWPRAVPGIVVEPDIEVRLECGKSEQERTIMIKRM